MTDAFMTKIVQGKQAKRSKTGAAHEKKEPERGGDRAKENMPSDRSCSADKNKGLLLVDASLAPQEITYPTELDSLNGCRERTERIIDELYIPASGKCFFAKKSRPSADMIWGC